MTFLPFTPYFLNMLQLIWTNTLLLVGIIGEVYPRSRGSTKRAHFRPAGDSNVSSVRVANKIARRVALLLEFHFNKNVHWVLEQPLSSILFRFKAIRRCLRKHQAKRVVTFLGAFGASTLKPVTCNEIVCFTTQRFTTINREFSPKIKWIVLSLRCSKASVTL